MSFALDQVPTEEISVRLAKAKLIHPMEPCRVGMYAAALAEILRLRRGEFTPTEFQDLCHKASEQDKRAFFAGCAEYQRKLFGEADIDHCESPRA